jgi:hypothetical protein
MASSGSEWQHQQQLEGDDLIVAGGTRKAAGTREKFVVPVPGSGTSVDGVLAGKTVVLTGLFPEVGGGVGLNLGKDRVKRMVESFGGKVTSSVSGKTDILLVGKEPGVSKVAKARSSDRCQIMSLMDVKGVLEGANSLEDLRMGPQLLIETFSSGYRGTGLGSKATSVALEWTAELAPATVKAETEPLSREEGTLDGAPGSLELKGAAETKRGRRRKIVEPATEEGQGEDAAPMPAALRTSKRSRNQKT